MIKNKLFFVALVLFLSSCRENKEVELKLLFKTYITDNGGKGNFNTKIGVSNSVFHIQEIEMAHIGGYIPVDTTNYLWVNGKEIKTVLSFNEIQKKYKTTNINLNKITESDSLSNLTYKSEKKLTIQQIKKGFNESFAEVNDECFVQLIDTASKNIFLKIKNKDFVKEVKLQSFSETNGAIIKSFEITKDKNKEIFILSQGTSYWGSSWKVEVYKLENLN
jgi:hypothetical protein